MDELFRQMQLEEEKKREAARNIVSTKKTFPKYDLKVKKSSSKEKKTADLVIPTTSCRVSSSNSSQTNNLVLDQLQGKPYEDVLQILQRELNRCGDENVVTRKQSLSALSSYLNPEDAAARLPEDVVRRLFLEELVTPLAKRLEDKAEQCREAAITILSTCINQCGDVEECAPYILPVVSERLQFGEDDHVPSEPSEEVRLALVRLLTCIVERFGRGIVKYLDDVSPPLQLVVKFDTNPEGKKAACECILALCDAAGPKLRFFAEDLAGCLNPVLQHRLAQVRVLGLQTYCALCHSGAHKTILDFVGHRDANTLNLYEFYKPQTRRNLLAMLAMDDNAKVRRTVYDTIYSWLMDMPEGPDFERFLQPYLFTGLSDGAMETRYAVFDMIEDLGKRYEEWNEKYVKDSLDYGGEDDWDPVVLQWLSPPFDKKRPRLGARGYVRDSAHKMLSPLSEEVTSWLSPTRLHAANLMRTIIAYSERWCTQSVDLVVKAIISAFVGGDEGSLEAPLIDTMLVVAKLSGHYFNPSSYLPLISRYFQVEYASRPYPVIRTLRILLSYSRRPEEMYSALPDLAAFIHTYLCEDADQAGGVKLVVASAADVACDIPEGDEADENGSEPALMPQVSEDDIVSSLSGAKAEGGTLKEIAILADVLRERGGEGGQACARLWCKPLQEKINERNRER
eukprot:Rmarinus@m.19629